MKSIPFFAFFLCLSVAFVSCDPASPVVDPRDAYLGIYDGIVNDVKGTIEIKEGADFGEVIVVLTSEELISGLSSIFQAMTGSVDADGLELPHQERVIDDNDYALGGEGLLTGDMLSIEIRESGPAQNRFEFNGERR